MNIKPFINQLLYVVMIFLLELSYAFTRLITLKLVQDIVWEPQEPLTSNGANISKVIHSFKFIAMLLKRSYMFYIVWKLTIFSGNDEKWWRQNQKHTAWIKPPGSEWVVGYHLLHRPSSPCTPWALLIKLGYSVNIYIVSWIAASVRHDLRLPNSSLFRRCGIWQTSTKCVN